jgi:putative ABC transport system permease protein
VFLIFGLRSLRRQSVRTALTVAGIAIGIMALVTVGALSAQLRRIVQRSESIGHGIVLAYIQPSAMRTLGAHLPELRSRLAHTAGVRAAIPEIIVPYNYGTSRERFGPPELIFSLPPQGMKLVAQSLAVASGRTLRAADRRVVTAGADFARGRHAGVGDVISLYGSSYRLAGIYEQSFTIFDAAVFVPFAEAQRIVRQAIPAQAHAVLPRSDIATNFAVIVSPGADPSLVAARIGLIDGLHASDPKRLNAGIEATTRLFDSIIFGAALVALIIGSLSIVNTMATAVRERTREIGIRKAIGASDSAILTEFVAESGLMGALGGIIGLLAGTALCAYLDARAAANGSLQLFDVTGKLALGAFVFSILLGAAAGMIPALSAARLRPTEALRRL